MRGGMCAAMIAAAASANAQEPAKPQAAAAADSTISETPSRLDAGLRTFAGACLIDPKGEAEQAGVGAGAVAALLPQAVGAGIDALTAALDAAGQDRVTSVTAVIPLENRPKCVQIARGVEVTSDRPSDEIKAALLAAPFLVELFIRSSRDRSAVSLMPTVVRYAQTLDGRGSGTRRRELFATVVFEKPGESTSSTVSLPLGSAAPRRGSSPHYFDPVGTPREPANYSPTGAAATPWIKTPFASVTSAAKSEAKTPAESVEPEVARGGPRLDADVASAARDAPAVLTVNGQTVAPPPVEADDLEVSGSGGDFKPPATAAAAHAGEAIRGTAKIGDLVQPVSMTIVLRETLKGSAIARALSSILKGGRSAIVDAADPAKQTERRAAELATWKTGMEAYAPALSDYYKKREAYCAAPVSVETLEGRLSAAADLLESQVKLTAAARAVDQPVPFTSLVRPGVGLVRDCGG